MLCYRGSNPTRWLAAPHLSSWRPYGICTSAGVHTCSPLSREMGSPRLGDHTHTQHAARPNPTTKTPPNPQVYLEGDLERGIAPADSVWTLGGGEGEDGCLLTLAKMNLELAAR